MHLSPTVCRVRLFDFVKMTTFDKLSQGAVEWPTQHLLHDCGCLTFNIHVDVWWIGIIDEPTETYWLMTNSLVSLIEGRQSMQEFRAGGNWNLRGPLESLRDN